MQNRPNLIPLLLANMLCIAALMSFVVIVGPVIRELGLQAWHGGLLVTVTGIIWLFTARMWGRTSDAKGRKIVLVSGIAGISVAYLCMAVLIDYALSLPVGLVVLMILLTLVRGAIGGFYAAVPTASAAFIADHFDDKTRTGKMALLGASNGIGMVLGPLVAGTVVSASLVLPMYIGAFLPACALLIVWRGLPPDKVEHKVVPANVQFNDPRIRLPVCTAFIAMSCVITCQIIIGFFALDVLHLSKQGAAATAGYIMACVGITLIVVQVTASKFKHIAPATWLKAGGIITSSGLLLVAVVSSPLYLALVYSVMAMGLGLIFPAMQALAANSVKGNEQGIAAGTVAASQALASIAAPMISTGIYAVSPTAPYIFWGVVMAVFSIFVMLRK